MWWNSVQEKLAFEAPTATIRLFKMAVYGWLMANTLFLFPFWDELWGPNSLIAAMPVPENLSYQIFYVLMHDWVSTFYWIFPVVQIAAILLWFSGKGRKIAGVVIFVVTLMLFLRAYTYLTGGHRLVYLLLFFLMFIDEDANTPKSTVNSNLFLLACKIQLILVYLFAGLYKLHGTYWLNGEALYYVMNLREFSHPWLQQFMLSKPWLLAAGTYAALAYQLLFPVLVWIKPIRFPFLLVGIIFHLLVAIGMGLPDFGIFMVLCYSMFVDDVKARRVLGLRNAT
jgi:hypothetical protein